MIASLLFIIRLRNGDPVGKHDAVEMIVFVLDDPGHITGIFFIVWL